MASSPSSSSSLSSRNWVYDVFPSFSGEDVRITFLSHFHKELERKLITAFKDHEIKRGQSLDPELKQAIKDSRIAVVILSKNYASSTWCLNELLEILKCKDQTVIPVFYGLDPSHVRKQTGDFGRIFQATCHMARNTTKEVKLQWKSALTSVANMFGYHSVKCGNEATMIEEIVDDILGKLLLTTSKDSEEFVGIKDHIAKMIELLKLNSEEVRMVGIWGLSGIGKTTIARILFNRLSRHFQGSAYIDMHFISKCKESYGKGNPDDFNMKLHLQENLLSKILGKEGIKVDHLGVVGQKLHNRKVLICIDDLDDQVVLDALVGQTHWFGRGSRIIVITKDKRFCKAHGIEHIYEVRLPSKETALEMFCRSAFKETSPPDGLMEFASDVALLAGNLPLGLKVLGSYLRGRDEEDLLDELPSLRDRLNGKIGETLRVSYDGLNNKKDKALFRHIACLFNGDNVNDVKMLLADSDLNVNSGLKSLVDKSLIHVTENTVEMHCLLQDMGKEIVRAQSDEPGEREFLVDWKNICNLLEYNTGTKKVLGIALDMDEIDELNIHDDAFKGMQNLLFLKFFTKKWNQKKEVRWHLNEGFNSLTHKLRLLRLDGYPMRCMPSKFRPENLITLRMRRSNLEKLWDGVLSLRGLKDMNMEGSENLKEIPDLSMATNLETLHLSYCSSLVELPSSIQYLNKLEKLEMRYCISLETLPTGINLRSLYEYNLHGCSRVKSFPDISTNISVIYLSYSGIEEFPSNLRLENLAALDMGGLKCMKTWKVSQPLTPLLNMVCPSNLTALWLSDIPGLVELPSDIHNFSELESLGITRCTNLETLPTLRNLKSLRLLDLDGCSRLRSFPDVSTNISELDLNKTAIEEVPWSIEEYSNLCQLYMSRCSSLRTVFMNISKLKKLTVADFSNCGALTEVNLYGSSSGDDIGSSLPYDHFPKVKLRFINCFNLDKEAFLQQPSVFFHSLCLSGEEVPSYFTHSTMIGTSLASIPLLHTRPPSQPLFRFRGCALVGSEFIFISDRSFVIQVCCRFINRLGVADHFDYAEFPGYFKEVEPPGDSLLFIFDCCFCLNKEKSHPAEVNHDHVDVQFHLNHPKIKLKECVIRIYEDDERSDKNDLCNEKDYIYNEECEDNNDNDLGSEPETGCWVFFSSFCSFLTFTAIFILVFIIYLGL